MGTTGDKGYHKQVLCRMSGKKNGSRKLAGNMRNCHQMTVGCCNVIITITQRYCNSQNFKDQL